MKTLITSILFWLNAPLDGYWQTNETTYYFGKEMIVFEDGQSDTYDYIIENDSIYLDYGLPFKIELLTKDSLVLSKRNGDWYMAYGFSRIRRR